MHIYDPYGWIVHSFSSLILIYVGIQCLLAYLISDFYRTEEKNNHVKHQKHGVFYESSYPPNYAINYFFQKSYLDVWQEQGLSTNPTK